MKQGFFRFTPYGCKLNFVLTSYTRLLKTSKLHLVQSAVAFLVIYTVILHNITFEFTLIKLLMLFFLLALYLINLLCLYSFDRKKGAYRSYELAQINNVFTCLTYQMVLLCRDETGTIKLKIQVPLCFYCLDLKSCTFLSIHR